MFLRQLPEKGLDEVYLKDSVADREIFTWEVWMMVGVQTWTKEAKQADLRPNTPKSRVTVVLLSGNTFLKVGITQPDNMRK